MRAFVRESFDLAVALSIVPVVALCRWVQRVANHIEKRAVAFAMGDAPTYEAACAAAVAALQRRMDDRISVL